MSCLAEMEVVYGLQLHPDRARRLAPVMRSLLQMVCILPFETEDARAAGALRATLKRSGSPIGAYDVLMAATALRRGLRMVTGNLSEFSRVGGLRLEDWRQEGQA